MLKDMVEFQIADRRLLLLWLILLQAFSHDNNNLIIKIQLTVSLGSIASTRKHVWQDYFIPPVTFHIHFYSLLMEGQLRQQPLELIGESMRL